MPHATLFEDLEVYKLARRLKSRIYEISLDFPSDEKFSLTNQIRRSSRSIGAQIAESWAKRRYINHFISKLTDADGEQHETRHWILCAQDHKFIDDKLAVDLLRDCNTIGRKLQTMMDKAPTFAKPSKILPRSPRSLVTGRLGFSG